MTALFLALLKPSFYASVLALVVILLRLLPLRRPKWVLCLLWGLVALRLLCPVSIESSLSLQPRLSAPAIQDIMTAPAPGNESPGLPVTGTAAVPDTVSPQIAGDLVHHTQQARSIGVSPVVIATWIWVTGTLILLLRALISYLRLRHSIATATRLRENIYQSERVSTPFILGLIRPRIYLPYGLDENAVSHVLAHETAHLHRGDHWWKPLGYVLLSLYWFSPVLWLAYWLLCKDIELACDERVIRTLTTQTRKDYAQVLLSLGIRRSSITACPLAFGEVGIKGRVKHVMSHKKPTFWVITLSLAALTAVAVCFLTTPKTPTPALPEADTTMQETQSGLHQSDIPTHNATTNHGDKFPSAAVLKDGTYTVGRFLWQHIALSYVPDGNNSYGQIYLYSVLCGEPVNGDSCSALTVKDNNGVTIYASEPDHRHTKSYNYTRQELITLLENRMLRQYSPGNELSQQQLEQVIPKSVNTISIHRYANPESPMETAYSVYCFDGVPTWFVEGEDLRFYEIITSAGAEAYAQSIAQSPLDAAITQAVLERLLPEEPEELVYCENHITLTEERIIACGPEGSPDCGQFVTVYAMVMESVFDLSGNMLKSVGGAHYPAAITFREEDGSFTLTEFWTPRDGDYYAPDIREKFPDEVENEALDTQKFVLSQSQNCYAQVLDYTGIRPDSIFAGLLSELIADAGGGQTAAECIQTHGRAYRELLYLGRYTLEYAFRQFQAGGERNYLSGEILAVACQEIMLQWGEAVVIDSPGEMTGQDWFDEFRANAYRLKTQYTQQEMQELYPGAWLLIQMENG